MKSKRAAAYISERKETPITGRERDIAIAVKAVELAEADAEDRLTDALIGAQRQAEEIYNELKSVALPFLRWEDCPGTIGWNMNGEYRNGQCPNFLPKIESDEQ